MQISEPEKNKKGHLGLPASQGSTCRFSERILEGMRLTLLTCQNACYPPRKHHPVLSEQGTRDRSTIGRESVVDSGEQTLRSSIACRLRPRWSVWPAVRRSQGFSSCWFLPSSVSATQSVRAAKDQIPELPNQSSNFPFNITASSS